ncbi:MAG: hypothetical protein EOO43_16120 [Flavobacterium sp.]|nr:MAG: hypothetical protein EOO43_16120 [Flavobacterium sp.]
MAKKSAEKPNRADVIGKTSSNHLSKIATWFFLSLILICIAIAATKECLNFLLFNFLYYTLAVSIAGLSALIPGYIQVKIPKYVDAGGAISILVLLVVFVNPSKAANYVDLCMDKSFSIIAHIKKSNGDVTPFINQEFSLLIGYHQPDPKTINSNGEVIFDNIPSQYIRDTVKLQPTNPKFKIVSQNSWTAIQHNEITFILVVDQDSTLVKGSLQIRDNKNNYPAKNAIILFDHEFAAKTNSDGSYRIKLPMKEGSDCEVSISHDGKVVYQDRTIISSKAPTSFIISPK